MDFYIYTKGDHDPQPMDPLVLYVFSIVLCNLPEGLFVWEPGCWFLDHQWSVMISPSVYPQKKQKKQKKKILLVGHNKTWI